MKKRLRCGLFFCVSFCGVLGLLRGETWDPTIENLCPEAVRVLDAALKNVSFRTPGERLLMLEDVSNHPDFECPMGLSLTERLEDEMEHEVRQILSLDINGKRYAPTEIYFCSETRGVTCRGAFADDTTHLCDLIPEAIPVPGPADSVRLLIAPGYALESKSVWVSRWQKNSDYRWRRGRISKDLKIRCGFPSASDPNFMVIFVRGVNEQLVKKCVWFFPPSDTRK